MASKEYFVWCDESIKKGEFYSNFYGGVLIQSKDVKYVNNALKGIVDKIKITEEIKWGKVDGIKLKAFIALMDIFFKLVRKNRIKVRIMFRQNAKVAKNLQQEHMSNEFFLLYYQFIKHAFGLQYSNTTKLPIYVRVHFDNLPDTISKALQFKEYIKGLERVKSFLDAKIRFRKEDIVEVDSKLHLPLQFLDVIPSSMQFRLNDKHKEKPFGKSRRGKGLLPKKNYTNILIKKFVKQEKDLM